MFGGIGFFEFLVVSIIGLLVFGLPIATVVLLVLLLRRNNRREDGAP
jgi:hypothetical protein